MSNSINLPENLPEKHPESLPEAPREKSARGKSK